VENKAACCRELDVARLVQLLVLLAFRIIGVSSFLLAFSDGTHSVAEANHVGAWVRMQWTHIIALAALSDLFQHIQTHRELTGVVEHQLGGHLEHMRLMLRF